MKRIATYLKTLLSGLVALIALLAVVNLAPTKEWQLVLNYFLISNYLLFYPANQMAKLTAKPTASADDTDDAADTNSLRRRQTRRFCRDDSPMQRSGNDGVVLQKDQSTQLITELCVWFAKGCGLLLIAPVLFFKQMVFDEEI